jgi:outer membrane protein assembly factor BamB
MRLARYLIVLLWPVIEWWSVTPGARAEDWLQWRGPTGDNHAPAGTTAPVSWGEDENLAWKVPVPGRGHSSPTVVGNRIYLTTADLEQQTQSLLIYDRQTGQQLAEKIVHQGGLSASIHAHNSHASSTVASDGQHVFALFCNAGAAWVTAFDLGGQQLWQQRAIGFLPERFAFGFGSSPVIVGGQVIVASEYDGPESGIVALDTQTGKQRWHAERPQRLSYSTPARATLGGKRCLLTSGANLLAAYDPTSGQQLWSTEGSTAVTCGTMVWDESQGLAFAGGGYPDKFVLAIRTSGDHAIVWSNHKIKSYEQSLLLVGDSLYAVADSGVAYCLRSADGEQQWKERLGPGGVSSSPLLVDGKIYLTNEQGTTFVFAASPERFELLAENQLGTDCYATPTPIGNRLYHRFAEGEGEARQEYLAAIGE